MPATTFHDLMVQFCDVAGTPCPDTAFGPDGVAAFTVTVDDVDVAITHDAARDPDAALVHVFYGPAPVAGEAQVLTQLLAANFHMDRVDDPAFSFDPDSREVVLRCRYPLERASGEHLYAVVQESAAIALRWREENFMSLDEPAAAAGMVRRGILIEEPH